MKARFLMIFAALMLVVVPSAFATNGMSMIGYGARMSAMGGASLGLRNDTNLMNTNPAAITSIKGQRADFGLGLMFPAVHFKNGINDLDADSAVFPLPSIGYVNGLDDSPFAFGIGFYAQGGMGATFPDVKHGTFRSYDYNPLTQDSYVTQEYHSNIGYLKFSPTVAYEVNEKLSVGLSVNIGYAMLEMKMPYSLPASALTGQIPGMGGMTFGQMFGAPMDQGGLGYEEVTAYTDMGDAVTAVGYGFKLGAQYEATDRLTFGVSYTNKSTLDFSGNVSMSMDSQFGDAYEKMVMGGLMQGAADPMNPTKDEFNNVAGGVNAQLAGMGIDMSKGMAAEYDVDIAFSWPQEFGFGAAYDISDRWVFAADLRWLNWKDSMEKFVMKVKNGQNPNINAMMGTPGGDMTLEMPLEWDNQVVIALGTEFLATPELALRAGLNLAQNPVPGNTVIPIFPAVVENHLTLGLGYQITEMISIDAAYELVLANEVTTDNSIIANEYNGATSELGENILHVTAGLKF